MPWESLNVGGLRLGIGRENAPEADTGTTTLSPGCTLFSNEIPGTLVVDNVHKTD